MKRSFLENQGTKTLVGLLNASDMTLRLNALWALKNLLFQADYEVKQSVVGHLGWPGYIIGWFFSVYTLLNDGDVAVQEQAMNLVRNFACGKEKDINTLVRIGFWFEN